MTLAVRAVGVTKHFRDMGAPRTWKDATIRRRHRLPPIEALRGVDLVVDAGAAVGVVGVNGAGKSTLLRVIAGVLVADEGSVEVQGRVGSLLELGVGFHPDLTGRESAVLAGVIAGLSRGEARRRMGSVCDFAGLEQFIDRPLRTYSSGMQARLAFAIATEVQPEVLLVDEVLAVGDVAFQQRCLERLRTFKRDGTAILVVSHDPDLVRMLCERAVWLDAGEVVHDGPVDEVIDDYLANERSSAGPAEHGSIGALLGVRLLDEDGRECRVVHAGAAVAVSVATQPVPEATTLAVRIVREDDLVCVDTSTPLPADETSAVLAFARLDLAPGRYRIEVGLYDPSWRRTIDHRHEAASLRVLGTASTSAALAPPTTWSVGDAGTRRARRRGSASGGFEAER
ncbi:MAG: polysaccharide ABC transporter ATP-binding protein [Acidimicrobiales bacterium]